MYIDIQPQTPIRSLETGLTAVLVDGETLVDVTRVRAQEKLYEVRLYGEDWEIAIDRTRVVAPDTDATYRGDS